MVIKRRTRLGRFLSGIKFDNGNKRATNGPLCKQSALGAKLRLSRLISGLIQAAAARCTRRIPPSLARPPA